MKRTPSSLERGIAAETTAAIFLKDRGLLPIARNLRCRAGELDLVCLDGAILVIVEVRLRASARFGGALASVTRGKQRRLIRAAQFHWQRRPDWRARSIRFDVLAVQAVNGAHTVEWIKDAFRAG